MLQASRLLQFAILITGKHFSATTRACEQRTTIPQYPADRSLLPPSSSSCQRSRHSISCLHLTFLISLSQYQPGSLCFACSTTSSALTDPAYPEHSINSYRLFYCCSNFSLHDHYHPFRPLRTNQLLIHQHPLVQYSDTSCIWILDRLFGTSINTVISRFANPPGEKNP